MKIKKSIRIRIKIIFKSGKARLLLIPPSMINALGSENNHRVNIPNPAKSFIKNYNS